MRKHVHRWALRRHGNQVRVPGGALFLCPGMFQKAQRASALVSIDQLTRKTQSQDLPLSSLRLEINKWTACKRNDLTL